MNYCVLSSQRELLSFVDGFRRIFVFGIGKRASGLINYLLQEGFAISGVIVSDGIGSRPFFEGVPVWELGAVRFYDSDGVILCVEETAIKAVAPALDIRVRREQVAYNYFMPSSFILRPEGDAHRSREYGFFSKYKELQAIGEQTGTDKAGDYHNYCNKYEFLLRDFRNREFTLLELGVFRGASIHMWRRFFQKARIVGVDINAACGEYVEEDDNTIILTGDISSKQTQERLRAYHPSVIVDDASHNWSDQINALFGLFGSLPYGGVYILEDIHTSFLPLNTKYRPYADQTVSAYRVVSAIAQEVTGDDRVRIHKDRELLPFIDDIEYIAIQTEMVCFIHDSCILIKK